MVKWAVMDDFVRRPKRSPLALTPEPAPVLVSIDTNGPVAAPAPLNARKTFEPLLQTPRSQALNLDEHIPKAPGGKPPKKKRKFKLPIPHTKLQWVIFAIIALLLLGGSAFAIYWFIIRDTSPPPVAYVAPEPEPEPAPTTGPSRMTGREVALDAVSRPAYAVQIENSPEARPQSGLVDADIVTEAVAEGGITRFNAIYHDNVPANIGPVRSLRPYYIDWFLPYKAPIVHAGGSPEALSDIRALGVQDLDHGVNGGSFRRVSNRYAPHNLYTTGAQMLELFSKKGYTNEEFTGLVRKAAEPIATPNASTINLKISSTLYNVTFAWDATTNTYARSQGGAAHKDADSGKQIAPNVVVVPVLSKSIHPNRVHTKYGTVGSGEVFVFQDGTVIRGTWTKPGRDAQWQFKDTAGNDIKLNPGQTWFTIIDAAGSVTFQ